MLSAWRIKTITRAIMLWLCPPSALQWIRESSNHMAGCGFGFGFGFRINRNIEERNLRNRRGGSTGNKSATLTRRSPLVLRDWKLVAKRRTVAFLFTLVSKISNEAGYDSQAYNGKIYVSKASGVKLMETMVESSFGNQLAQHSSSGRFALSEMRTSNHSSQMLLERIKNGGIELKRLLPPRMSDRVLGEVMSGYLRTVRAAGVQHTLVMIVSALWCYSTTTPHLHIALGHEADSMSACDLQGTEGESLTITGPREARMLYRQATNYQRQKIRLQSCKGISAQDNSQGLIVFANMHLPHTPGLLDNPLPHFWLCHLQYMIENPLIHAVLLLSLSIMSPDILESPEMKPTRNVSSGGIEQGFSDAPAVIAMLDSAGSLQEVIQPGTPDTCGYWPARQNCGGTQGFGRVGGIYCRSYSRWDILVDVQFCMLNKGFVGGDGIWRAWRRTLLMDIVDGCFWWVFLAVDVGYEFSKVRMGAEGIGNYMDGTNSIFPLLQEHRPQY
ncbi:uncharacterized protein BDR25DRAFT_359644 [Lindgomyces ingoldianus]|uniref:Uncharacterized protein n=1 Tax=Lindgomyces ingoldianus TaxID=673940 RepID=A0ACB6QH67_9PLEO|nr:uncharacterized protein BDR25DRAFT_359644 [Lindgomyces ingoldianus]KAF2466276.1 hypothetical protein BDR25DRAFT_359644 [Lindgomyces ingoldianus]